MLKRHRWNQCIQFDEYHSKWRSQGEVMMLLQKSTGRCYWKEEPWSKLRQNHVQSFSEFATDQTIPKWL
uniref:Uncharacterized protein n=1 Tax=Anopheles atroparvus TaxID=41427 RepID=A0AAG5DNU1_ANOAO